MDADPRREKTKRVTIKDIAELAGVSATASLVLNGRGKSCVLRRKRVSVCWCPTAALSAQHSCPLITGQPQSYH
ncbi:MAG: LacI family DNA-binding transcriptional regulator [Escherichia coli]